MKLFLFFLSIITWIGCTNNKADTTAEGEKLMQLSREWSKVAGTNDIEKTLSYWADTAVMLSNGLPMLKGKGAIRQMIEETATIPGFNISWEPVSVTVSENGDMAYMIEKNKITMPDSAGRPVVKYSTAVTIWRKNGEGQWKNVVEIMNDDPVIPVNQP